MVFNSKAVIGHLSQYWDSYVSGLFVMFMIIVWLGFAPDVCYLIVSVIVLIHGAYGVIVGAPGLRKSKDNESDYDKKLLQWRLNWFWNGISAGSLALLFFMKYLDHSLLQLELWN